MSYTPPTGNALDIVFTTGGYTPATGNALSMDFSSAPAVLEQLSASDTTTAGVVTNAAQVEAASATDVSLPSDLSQIVESASAADTTDSIAFTPITEAGTASDSVAGITGKNATQTESGTATDAAVGGMHIPAFSVEVGTASDFLVSGFGQSADISEAGTATDATDRSWGTAGAITEAGTASDASDQGTIGLAHEIESDPWATDATDATNTTNSAITEAGGATDTSLSNRQWEDWAQGLATDTTNALAYMGASQEDDGAATDAPIAINFTYPQVAQEILNATDTVAGGVSTAVAIAESGTASDATDATAPLRKGNTILYRLELVASNAIQYGVSILATNDVVSAYSFRQSNVITHSIRSKVKAGNQSAYALTSAVKQGCSALYGILTYTPVVADSRAYYGMPSLPTTVVVVPNSAAPPAIVPASFYQNVFASISTAPNQDQDTPTPYMYPIQVPAIGLIPSVPFIVKAGTGGPVIGGYTETFKAGGGGGAGSFATTTTTV